MRPPVRYKAVSNKILAHAYAISVNTLRKWLEPIAEKLGGKGQKVYTPKQVGEIVQLLGEPEHITMIQVKDKED